MTAINCGELEHDALSSMIGSIFGGDEVAKAGHEKYKNEDLTDVEVEEGKELFRKFDENGDLHLDMDELNNVLKSHNMLRDAEGNDLPEKEAQEKIDKLLAEVDEDGNGVIELPGAASDHSMLHAS